MCETIVHCEALRYQYPATQEEGPAREALLGVDFCAKKGEFVAVLGHNGSGKSTLGRQINALLTPTAGRVVVCGMDTREEALLWEIRKRVGMVFQNPDNQMVASVVEDDVAFGPENIGVPSAELRTRVDDALSAVGMRDFAQRAPHSLSGGQKQRVAIAGVLALQPDVLIMDEPTAMLDPSGRQEVMNTIHSLRQRGITVILVTHYMEEAAQADRIVVMHDGSVLLQGTPQEVFAQRERLLACALELPPMAEFCHLAAQAGFALPQSEDVEEVAEALCQYLSAT